MPARCRFCRHPGYLGAHLTAAAHIHYQLVLGTGIGHIGGVEIVDALGLYLGGDRSGATGDCSASASGEVLGTST